jgi:uncharacterized protein Yka (UPF0111/DUF47 family)
MKSKILDQLKQSEFLLPGVIADGLSANDRIKARLSVLQAAAAHARKPDGRDFDLSSECRAAGLDPGATDELVGHATISSDGRLTSSGLEALLAAIWGDATDMVDAVGAGDTASAGAFEARLAAIRADSAQADSAQDASDTIAFDEVARLTEVSGTERDSLHRLVMDLHKALNRLAASHAEESLAGAHVYGLLEEDRPAVESFMRGVESTRKLKFDHPGLSTMAIRANGRLTIQNDIGETDAHVVVIAVERDTVTLTYTDVHLARAKFFTRLFDDFAVEWSGLDRHSADGLGDDGAFYLVTGHCHSADDRARCALLEAIGAALVFLIDWNKARKVLRDWVSKGDAIHVLEFAARHRFGHRGFLELGGRELVANAVHHAASARIGFGERLDDALGREAAVEFLQNVLRIAAETLLEGGSPRLARDRIEADLVQRLQRVDAKLLAIVLRQSGLARQIAADIGHFLAARRADALTSAGALAVRARLVEEKADRIALEARGEIARLQANPLIGHLVDSVEQAIDELEQAAFICSLAPPQMAPVLLKPLEEVCAAAVAGTEAAASGVTAAMDLPDRHRADANDALAAVGRLIDAEHCADTAERNVTANVFSGEFDLKTSLSALDLARSLERATDRLAGFGHLLRERVLADLSA